MTIRPLPGLQHVFRSLPSNKVLAGEIDREDPIPVRACSSLGRPDPSNAGVVDQHVDPAERCDDLSNNPRDLRVLHDVGLPGPGPAPQRARNRFDMRRFIDERELRSALAEQFRNRFSDPAGRSGYQDDPAREVEDARKFKRALVC